MKGFDKLNIKSAVKSHSKMSLNQIHLTTLDFGQIVPLYHKDLIPGDKFTVDMNLFTRTAPVVKPTYGKFSLKTLACFVPYNMVAFDAEAFMAGMTVFQSTTPYLRYISYLDFVNFIISNCASVNSTDYHDFRIYDNSGTMRYYVLTNYGRYIYKVLTSLGYTFPTNVSLQTTSSWYVKFANTNLNAMPIICFFKAFNDILELSSRANIGWLSEALRHIKYNINNAVVGYNSTTHRINSVFLASAFNELKVCYENDYFTSAWYAPESITATLQSVNQIDTEGISGDAAKFNTTTGVYSVRGNSATIYQRTLDLAESFYNWSKRNNYVGSREVQQVFARLGIKTGDYKSHYTHLITTKDYPINVGDVTAQAQSTNVPLGDYAGKAIAAGVDDFHYESNDYGMLFVFGFVTVSPMMAYGFERHVLKTQALEFYNPEFDGVGVDAISYGEVFANPIPDANDVTFDDSVYGYTERYNDYRYGRDQITGDFRRMTNSDPMNVWHSGRLLNDVRKNMLMVAQNYSMCQLMPYNSEYNRIFSVPLGDVDHFYLTSQFKVTAVRPMLSLNQVPGLGEGNLSVSRNGNEVN